MFFWYVFFTEHTKSLLPIGFLMETRLTINLFKYLIGPPYLLKGQSLIFPLIYKFFSSLSP